VSHISSKILLHCCCGPCSLASIDVLLNLGFDVTALFFNPNIWPEEEHKKRLEAWIQVCKFKNIKHIIKTESDYIPGSGKNRCISCYEKRLSFTSQMAKELGFLKFTTTLLISIYQHHDKIREIGSGLSGFYYIDLRENYKTTIEAAKQIGIYRQKYCGCEKSIVDSLWLSRSKRFSRHPILGPTSPWKPDYFKNQGGA